MRLDLWLLAFVSMAVLDVVWVLYMQASNKLQPLRASLWAAAIHVFGALAILSYVDDHRYLSATLPGTFVGTYAVVWWTRQRDLKKENR